MPNIMPHEKIREQKSFALMIRSGESIAPPQIAEIRTRTGLSPIFITSLFGGELDTSRLYARALGANLFLPRCASDAAEILSACNFSICESAESAILSISARVPAYLSVSTSESRSLAALLYANGISERVIIPYTKNRTGAIEARHPHESELSRGVTILRSLIF